MRMWSRVLWLQLLCAIGAHAFADLPATGLRPRTASSIQRCRGPRILFFAKNAQNALHQRSLADSGSHDDAEALRVLLLPVWLSVFVHMLGVGITLSQLPLYLTSLGASPTQLGLAISGFSLAQMVGCPLLISLSGRVGRLHVMRVCLAGNAAASLLTACASSWQQIAFARVLAGFFAAAVPVSQAAVTDVVEPGPSTSRALSQVAAASSLGIVAGPAVAGLIAEFATRFLGTPAHLVPPIVFAASGIFAAAVCVVLAIRSEAKPTQNTAQFLESGSSHSSRTSPKKNAWFAQPVVRWIALMTSWSLTLAVATYALFATRFLGYAQSHINGSQVQPPSSCLMSLSL